MTINVPLKDWALAFKPYMWGFFTLGDARGFSFYHFFMIASFILGYTVFLMQLRLPLLYSLIIALTLFFSHHHQVWWSNNAAVFSLTIWIIIPFLTNWPLFIKFITTFLISAAALLSLLYPPWQISVIYLVGIFALVFRPERFRIGNLLTCFVGFALAAGLCLYYLADIVPLVQNTVYPGDRSFNGGSSRLEYLWTLLFPHSLIMPNYRPIVSGTNMPEIGTVSSLFFLCLLAFGDYKALLQTIKKNIVKTSILVAFAVIIFSWMYLPVPNTIGKFILLDQIEPKRLLLASGTFVIWLVAILAFNTRWVLSWTRVLLYSLIVLVGSYMYKQSIGSAIGIDRWDVCVLVPVAFVILLKLFQNTRSRRNVIQKDTDLSHTIERVKLVQNNITQNDTYQYSKKNIQRRLAYVFASLALVYNVMAFAGFNPIQSTHDIFSIPEDPKVLALKAYVEESNLEGLAISRHTAAAASGLSIPTYNHVLLTPQLDFFREEFPDLDDTTFNTVFNRYTHVAFNSKIDEPKLVQADYIELPMTMVSERIPVVTDDIDVDVLVDDVEIINSLNNSWQTDTLLSLRFRSPNVLKHNDLSVLTSDGMIAKAEIQPLLLFTDYFAGVVTSPEDAILWELKLNFPHANTSLDDLKAIDIKVGDKYYKIALNESKVVETFQAKQDKSYPIRGVLDKESYDHQNAALIVTGWAPVDDMSATKVDEQFFRWFGYETNLDVELKSITPIPRPDVATLYGDAQKQSGFYMIFDVKTPPANQEDIEFCLFGRTKATGVFHIISESPISICSSVPR